jgi:hypothetical protein
VKRSFFDFIRHVNRTKALLVLGSLLYLVILVTLTFLVPLDGDEGIYAGAARLIANGLRPFQDFFLTKSPYIALPTSLIYKIYQPTEGYLGIFLMRLVPILMCLIIPYIAYAALNKLNTHLVKPESKLSRKQLIFIVLTFVTAFNFIYMGISLKPETFLIFLQILSVYLALKAVETDKVIYYALMGFALAFSVYIKFTAVFIIPVLLVLLVLVTETTRQRLTALAKSAIPFAFSILGLFFLLALAFGTTLSEFISFTVSSFTKYDLLPDQPLGGKLIVLASFLLKEPIVLITIAVVAYTIFLRLITKRSLRVVDLYRDKLFIFAVLWVLGIVLPTVLLPKTWFAYFFPALFPVCVVAFLLLRKAYYYVREDEATIRQKFLAGVLALIVTVFVLSFEVYPDLSNFLQSGLVIFINQLVSLQHVFILILAIAALILLGKLNSLPKNILRLGEFYFFVSMFGYFLLVAITTPYIYAPQYFISTTQIAEKANQLVAAKVDKVAAFQGIAGNIFALTGIPVIENKLSDLPLRFDYDKVDIDKLPASFPLPNRLYTEIKKYDYALMDIISWRFLEKYQPAIYNYLYWNYTQIDGKDQVLAVWQKNNSKIVTKNISRFSDQVAYRVRGGDLDFDPYLQRVYFGGYQMGVELQSVNFVKNIITKAEVNADNLKVTPLNEDIQLIAASGNLNWQVLAKNDSSLRFSIARDGSNATQFVLNGKRKPGYFDFNDGWQLWQSDKLLTDFKKLPESNDDVQIVVDPLQKISLRNPITAHEIIISGNVQRLRIKKELGSSAIIFETADPILNIGVYYKFNYSVDAKI